MCWRRVGCRRSNSPGGRARLRIASDANVSRADERGDGDPSRRQARRGGGGHIVSRRLNGLLAIRASPRLHRCDLRPRRRGGRGPRRPERDCALAWSAPTSSRLCSGESRSYQQDRGTAGGLLREHPEQAVPARGGPRTALTPVGGQGVATVSTSPGCAATGGHLARPPRARRLARRKPRGAAGRHTR